MSAEPGHERLQALIDAIWDVDYPDQPAFEARRQQVVLLALAFLSEPTPWQCFAPKAQLARMTSCSERTTLRALRGLERIGYIERAIEPNTWRLRPDRWTYRGRP